MFDWTKYGQDPNSHTTIQEWISFYENNVVKFDLFSPLNRDERILDLCKIKSNSSQKILDVGFAEHGLEYAKKTEWFHAKLRNNQHHTVYGLDINQRAVEEIQKYTKLENLLIGDAEDTNTIIAGGDFDVIHAGDVIEHLSNPGDFLIFCKNNLNENGRLVITTPNPICRYSIPTYKSQGFWANMEHTCWISPTNMNELCRRSGLYFSESHYMMNKKRTLKNILRERHIRSHKDLYFSEFQYVLTHKK